MYRQIGRVLRQPLTARIERETLLPRVVTGKHKTLQIARICRFEAHRRQITPCKANLRLFRDFSGCFEPVGNPHTFPVKLNINGHTCKHHVWAPCEAKRQMWRVSGRVVSVARRLSPFFSLLLFASVTNSRLQI